MVKPSRLKITKIVNVETPDVNGKKYQRITVMPLPKTETDEVTGEVFEQIDMDARPGSFNQYGDSYLTPGNPDPAFGKAEGTRILGAIVRREVQPYTFINAEGEEVHANFYTTVVFGDDTSSDWENKVMRTFRSNERPLITDTEYVAVDKEAKAADKNMPEPVEANA